MPRRWGLGPVFVYESLINARRRQLYAGRALAVLVLLIGMTFVWFSRRDTVLVVGGRSPTFRQMAQVGEWFFYALTGTQVSLVLLAAPAATAGAICLDRARGTLLHMLVTDLSDVEIVLGKLGGRLAPVFGLIVVGVPVSALAALLGGVDFGALLGAFVVSMALAVLGCSLALAISVRASKTHEVLMAVYLLEGLWLLALPVWRVLTTGGLPPPPDWFWKANPYVLVFAPYTRPGYAGVADFAAFVGVALALSAALLAWSIATLRRAVIEPARRPRDASRPRPRWQDFLPTWPGPSLDGNPVLWREWHRSRPSKLERRLWWALLLSTWAVAIWGIRDLVVYGHPMRPTPLPFAFMFQVFFGLLMISATAPTALAEERVRGSLDVLLATPLSTASIVLAKWWGTYRRVLILAPMPLVAGITLAITTPTRTFPAGARLVNPVIPLSVWDRTCAATLCAADFLASGAVIVSLGLALATWIPRLGRAVSLSVSAFVLMGLGWIFLVFWSFSVLNWRIGPGTTEWAERFDLVRHCMLSISPFMGAINPLSGLEMFLFQERGPVWIGMGLVAWMKAITAGLLLVLTIRTFDRCLGRVPESGVAIVDEEPVTAEEPVASAP